MNTQVIFKVDKKLKEKAMKKAQANGITFTSVLKFATRAFADGDLEVGLQLRPKENIRKMLARELKETKERKNISPAFTNAQDAIAYLKSL